MDERQVPLMDPVQGVMQRLLDQVLGQQRVPEFGGQGEGKAGFPRSGLPGDINKSAHTTSPEALRYPLTDVVPVLWATKVSTWFVIEASASARLAVETVGSIGRCRYTKSGLKPSHLPVA